MALNDIYLFLSQRFYPTGRAFRMPEPADTLTTYTPEDGLSEYTTEDGLESYTTEDSTSSGGILFRLHRALSLSFARLHMAAKSTLDSIHPGSPNFTIADAHRWYKHLGIYDSGLVPLADMKLAILQKRSFPLTPLDKQSPAYIQAQLRAAGFDVYVYKNKFSDGSGGWVTKKPTEVLGIPAGVAILDEFELDEVELDESFADDGITLCVNYLEEDRDATFDIPDDDYRGTFYISGSPITTFATVDINRKIEFRQLILKLKRAEMAAILFVQYV